MADQILTLNGKQAAAGSGVINLLPPDYISGLEMIWNSATSLSVTTGAACRPSDSLLMMPVALITKAGLTLTASTWYHLYLYMNGANPDVEIVTTAPAAAYFGTARAKTGDTTRRYVGSVLTDASGNVRNFKQSATVIRYIGNVANGTDVYRILSGGDATVATNISAATCIPVTSKLGSLRVSDTDSSIGFYLASGDYAVSNGNGQISVPPANKLFVDAACDSNQSYSYIFVSTPTGAAYVDVLGYTFER